MKSEVKRKTLKHHRNERDPRNYYQQLYGNKFYSLENGNNFLGTHNFQEQSNSMD